MVAVLLGGSKTTVERWLSGLPEGLSALGYVEHRDYEIEYRYADGDLSRLPKLAGELALLRPNGVVVGGTAAARLRKEPHRMFPLWLQRRLTPSSSGSPKMLADPGAMSPEC